MVTAVLNGGFSNGSTDFTPLPSPKLNPLTGMYHTSGFSMALDGVTDDSAHWTALIASVNADGGGTIAHDGISLAAEIDLPANVALRLGPLATIKALPSATVGMRIGAFSRIYGGGTLDFTGMTGTGLVIQGDFVTVEDIAIIGSTLWMIAGNNIHRPIIRRVRFTGAAASTSGAIFIQCNTTTHDWIGPYITDCTIDCSASTGINGSGISLFGDPVNGWFLTGSRVKDNNVTLPLSPASANAINITARLNTRPVISGNDCYGGQMGVSLDTSSYGTVANNTITSASQYGIEMPRADHYAVLGNTINGSNLTTRGIMTDSSAPVTSRGAITGNIVEGVKSGGVGIWVGSGSTRTTVTGNQITLSNAAVFGIHVGDGTAYTANAAITGNVIDGGAGLNVYGIHIDSVSGFTVVGNVVFNIGSGGNCIRVAATTAITVDNFSVTGNSLDFLAGAAGYIASMTGGAALGTHIYAAGNSR